MDVASASGKDDAVAHLEDVIWQSHCDEVDDGPVDGGYQALILKDRVWCLSKLECDSVKCVSQLQLGVEKGNTNFDIRSLDAHSLLVVTAMLDD